MFTLSISTPESVCDLTWRREQANPRVLRSRSSRVIPPSSSQTEDTDIRAPLGMSAPATDARSDKQDFLDSILSSMQEQQRLMTFLIERQQQQLTAQTHPAVPSPSTQLAQLSPLARRVGLPKLRRLSRFNHQLCRLHLPTQGQVIQSSSFSTRYRSSEDFASHVVLMIQYGC